MAKKLPVHVLPREGGSAVVREGNERANAFHRTQAEAGEEGREAARKDRTAFLLRAKDGRVRDRSDYGGDPSPPKERPEGRVAGVASTATQATGGALGLVSGVVGGAVEGLGRTEKGPMLAEDRVGETPGEGSADTEAVGSLTYEKRYATIDLKVMPSLPPEVVVAIYRKARREISGDHKYRRIEEKGLKMIRFVAGFEEPPKGRRLLEAWDNTEWVKKNPKWSYDEGKPGASSRFWNHYHSARRALAYTKRSEISDR